MSALNLLVKAPVIPFQKRKEESQIQKAKLEHFVTMNVTVSGVTQAYREKRTASVAIAEDDDVEEVHIDCIGNWNFPILKANKIAINVRAVTMIDPVTNLLEIAEIKQAPTAEIAMRAFENTWLCRYPKPLKVICDRGPEFIGHEFPAKLLEAGIQFKPVTAKNPQSNGIIERVHQTISLILRVLIDQRKPDTQEACQRLVEDGLSTAMHATRAAAHSSLEYCTPGSLAFGRDMVLKNTLSS